MTDDAASFAGTIPDHYDRELGPIIFAPFAAEMARRVAAQPALRVLETAAGTGIVTHQLLQALPATVQLTATDLNAPMLAVARAKLAAGGGADFQTADATALPFQDAAFDTVVCQFGLMFFPDKPKSFREVHRVLSPGGRYLFSVWDSHACNAFGRLTHAVAIRLFPADPPQFYAVPFSCHAIDPIKRDVLDAGFSNLEISITRLQTVVADLAAFARGLVYGNPLIDQIRARGGVDPDRVMDDVLQGLRQEFGAEGRMQLQAVVYTATKAK